MVVMFFAMLVMMVVMFLAMLVMMVVMFLAMLVMVVVMMLIMIKHSIFPEGQNVGLRQCHQRHASAIAG